MQAAEDVRDILIYTNTGCFPDKELRYYFEDWQIAVTGPHISDAVNGNVHQYALGGYAGSVDKLSRTYDFQAAVFVSGYLTYDKEQSDESVELERFLRQCRKHSVSRIICLLPFDQLQNGADTDRHEDGVLSEMLCRYYADAQEQIALVYCPFLSIPSYQEDYFHTMFAALESGKGWSFPEPAGRQTNFITSRDLCSFLSDYLDIPQKEDFQALHLRNFTEHTFGDAAAELGKMYPGQQVVCAGEPDLQESLRESAVSAAAADGSDRSASDITQAEEDVIWRELGWFARDDVFGSAEELRAAYLENREEKETLLRRLGKWMSSHRLVVAVAEIVLGALVMELLNHLLHNSVQLRVIDVRLLYVVIIAIVYGIKGGIIAALFACLSLLLAYDDRGVNGVMLFYEPSNWLAFALYFATGGFCGLQKKRHDVSEKNYADRVKELEQETAFTDQLYEEAIDDRTLYRQELISSRNGFGRIYAAVQKLAVTEPSKIYEESVIEMEDILQNHSIAIYSVSSREAGTARMEVSSRELEGRYKKHFIHFSDHQDVIDVLNRGEIWVNRKLLQDRPMYAAGIFSGEELRILIILWKAEFGQMTAYYENLLRVLTGLIRTFLQEAWLYQEATVRTSHIGQTPFLTGEAFQRELQIRREMADNELSGYMLLEISADGRSPEEMERILSGMLSDGDMATYNSGEGKYYVLIPEADEAFEKETLDRLCAAGLRSRTLETGGDRS